MIRETVITLHTPTFPSLGSFCPWYHLACKDVLRSPHSIMTLVERPSSQRNSSFRSSELHSRSFNSTEQPPNLTVLFSLSCAPEGFLVSSHTSVTFLFDPQEL